MAPARQKTPAGTVGYGATWYAQSMVETAEHAPLNVDVDADVCVIGGGLAGLTVARELVRRGWSVVLLEAGRIAANASGRNTGIVAPGFSLAIEAITERVGLEHAQQVWKLSAAGVDYVRQTIDGEELRGVDPVPGWLDVATTDAAGEIAWRADVLRKVFDADVEVWPTERVRATLRTSRYFQALHFGRAFHIHPLNYALGLAAAAEKAGARIYEDTRALAIDPDGIRKRVVTRNARVRAEQVVLAGSVQLGEVMPPLGGTLLPIWSYTAVTESIGPELGAAIGYRGAISDSHLAGNQYRVLDDRLMWSGRMTTWEAQPRRFASRLKADIARIYPQLRDVEIASVWSGVIGRTVHQMPQIGEIHPGIWVASGFGGQGLNSTAMAGELIARAIAEGDDEWRLFLPFELIWAGGMLGRGAVQSSYWYARVRERLAGGKSRVLSLLVPAEPARPGMVSHIPPSDPPDGEPTSNPPVPEAEMASAETASGNTEHAVLRPV